MKLSNAHSRVRKKSLTKQNCFKKNHWERKTLPHCTRCSQTSQPLWNAVSIAVRPEWLVDPRDSTRRLEQANNNIDMADCKSPIVSARSQPLRHNVAIRSVFIIITKRFAHLLFLLPCAILQSQDDTQKHSWGLNYTRIATSKEVAGTINGSCWLKTSIWKASHWTVAGFSVLIASEQNELSVFNIFWFSSLTTLFVCLLLNVN